MKHMTLDELRLTSEKGSIVSIRLETGRDGAFFVGITTDNDEHAVLTGNGNHEPRCFTSRAKALRALEGIAVPFAPRLISEDEKEELCIINNTAYNEYVARAVQETIDQDGPSTPHKEITACLSGIIARFKAK